MRILIGCVVSVLWCVAVSQAAVLESPQPGDTLSGIGFISGWKCEAGQITVRIDDGSPVPVLYGNARLDTHVSSGGPCQQHNTGYILQVNWAEFGDGRHTVVAADNGHEFARHTFHVMTPGVPFLPNATGTCAIADFPAPGETGHFRWTTSTQHLELVGMDDVPDATRSPHKSTVYWRTRETIERANLDGSQRETIISGIQAVRSIALDEGQGKIYWVSDSWESGFGETIHEIWRANLDGSGQEHLLTSPHEVYQVDVDAAHGKLYWITDAETIERANLDGSQVETVLQSQAMYITHFVVDAQGGYLYWVIVERPNPAQRRYDLRRMALAGGPTEVLFTFLNTKEVRWVRDFAVDPTTEQVYWATGGELWRANVDGSARHIVARSPEAPFDDEDDDGAGPFDLAIDLHGGKIYWTTDDYPPDLRRANLDGSQEEIMARLPGGPIQIVLGGGEPS